jgi:primosomal protein N' (replication factor Y) (superfamily II helicase)
VTTRVCRVVVDVVALERPFDYLVPEELAEAIGVGVIVRVPLHGRRVRAWVVADDVESEALPERLRPIAAVVSAGPPADIVDLTAWAAWRWSGPRLALLRTASPPAVVPVTATFSRANSSDSEEFAHESDETLALAREAARLTVAVLRWPPAGDVAGLVAALLPGLGSAIVVIPDTRAETLARQLPGDVVFLRSDGRPSDRARAWSRARSGSCVVVGGRAAVWAPVPDLGAVIVLDEGSEALKEERSPLWHARDVALERARRLGARVTLISPVPSLEAAAAGPVLAPARSVERDGWPVLEVVDRRREPPGFGLFTPRLVEAVRAAAMSSGDTRYPGSEDRVVCVLNRRGRARLLACDACGELVRCGRCGTALREEESGLVCPAPTCGEERPRLCDHCGSTRLRVLRAGVTRVAGDLAALVPRASVGVVDRDTDELPSDPVLIGTEAVLHRLHRASLVAFLDFDAELLAPRFRAGEHALWLLARAARLVGPRSGGGRLLVQTRLPSHEVLQSAVRADPGMLLAAEASRRAALALPPYSALARLTGEAPALEAAAKLLRDAGLAASMAEGSALLVRATSSKGLADALASVLPTARAAGRLRTEVDPLRV